MQDLGRANVARRRVVVGDAAVQGGAAFEQEESSVVSDVLIEDETYIRLGFCAGCGLAFHSNETEIAAKCFFCPSVLCATCAATRCHSCTRVCCPRCAWRIAGLVLCLRHLLLRALGIAMLAIPAAGLAALFFLLVAAYLGGT